MIAGPFEAIIVEDLEEVHRQTVRLVVVQREGPAAALLMGDGTWYRSPEATALPPEKPGLVLPRAAVETVRHAIETWQGAAGSPATEARILREWLELERSRVDRLIERGLT